MVHGAAGCNALGNSMNLWSPAALGNKFDLSPTALASLEPFTAESIEAALRAAADGLGLKPRQAFQPVRVAVTGSKISPGLFESIELLGRDETLDRLRAAAAA